LFTSTLLKGVCELERADGKGLAAAADAA
jgi:hypothetical protein